MLVDVMTLGEIENTRRSAACAPLPPATVQQVLAELAQLVEERERIVTIVNELPPTFGALRESLNELHRIVS